MVSKTKLQVGRKQKQMENQKSKEDVNHKTALLDPPSVNPSHDTQDLFLTKMNRMTNNEKK